MKKGFTMVELLAIIIIVGTIGIMSFASLTNTIKKNKVREQEVFETNIINAAKLYLASHLDDFSTIDNDDFKAIITTNYLISEKYLYGTSPYDIQLMNKLLSHERVFSIENEYPHIFNTLINNSEYLTKYISLQTSKSFLNTTVNLSFEHLCSLNNKRCTHRMLRKAEMFVNKKKHMNIGLNSVMKNNNTTNTKYNNLLLNNYKLNINSTNSNSNENNNNSSSFNCNSISLNCNTVDNKESNLNKGQLAIIGLDNIVEKIENVDDSDECEEEDFFNFLRFDLKRKINKKAKRQEILLTLFNI